MSRGSPHRRHRLRRQSDDLTDSDTAQPRNAPRGLSSDDEEIVDRRSRKAQTPKSEPLQRRNKTCARSVTPEHRPLAKTSTEVDMSFGLTLSDPEPSDEDTEDTDVNVFANWDDLDIILGDTKTSTKLPEFVKMFQRVPDEVLRSGRGPQDTVEVLGKMARMPQTEKTKEIVATMLRLIEAALDHVKSIPCSQTSQTSTKEARTRRNNVLIVRRAVAATSSGDFIISSSDPHDEVAFHDDDTLQTAVDCSRCCPCRTRSSKTSCRRSSHMKKSMAKREPFSPRQIGTCRVHSARKSLCSARLAEDTSVGDYFLDEPKHVHVNVKKKGSHNTIVIIVCVAHNTTSECNARLKYATQFSVHAHTDWQNRKQGDRAHNSKCVSFDMYWYRTGARGV